MITGVTFQRFKRFRSETVPLLPRGVTLIAGGNNAGKSSLLQGLAVWQFCKTAIEMERGYGAFLAGSHHLGLGLGDDEFSPIAVPSLKHLWTNLKTQKTGNDPDGYTLRIGCSWASDEDTPERRLEFGLALANDRLFIRVTHSNLSGTDRIPTIAYLPPFAGITDREMRVPEAIRRRKTGEGLAGAVLRNLLLDMSNENETKRARARENKSKISDADLKRLRRSDPWELLQQTLRERFAVELRVEPFREEYHSYIRITIDKGKLAGYKLKRHPGYNPRDLMVEGSGFLQWLSVYALAVSRDVDVLLLDEPDAHLHPTLQAQLMDSLETLADSTGKQVLVATHSVELLRKSEPTRIMEIRRNSTRYLIGDHQKSGLLVGLGSDYAPKLDPIRQSRKVLFVEGPFDGEVLSVVAKTIGEDFPREWTVWRTSRGHRERKQIFLALQEDIPDLRAVSLRDRDDESMGTVNERLDDGNCPASAGFLTLKWPRRHIENYLLWPPAIARAKGVDEEEVRKALGDEHALAIGDSFTHANCPQALKDARGKEIFEGTLAGLRLAEDGGRIAVARQLRVSDICEDLRTFFSRLKEAES